MGIGISTGELMLGTMGGANRIKCTVIGDTIGATVNLAARVEGLTRQFGEPMLITDSTRDRLPDPAAFGMRAADRVRVVGRSAPSALFEVFDGDPPGPRDSKRRTLPIFERGMELYLDRAFERAARDFEQCVAVHPEDHLAATFVGRCRRYAADDPGPDWDGVERSRVK